jgi:hypothetical protein
MIRHLLSVVLVCALASIAATGCGGAAPQAKAAEPAAGLVEDLSTPEGAAAAVDHAERAIDQLLGPPQRTVAAQQGAFAQAPQPAEAAPSPPPPPPPATHSVAPSGREVPSPGRAEEKADEPARGVALDACSTACSALASMERAADHLCRLAGSADERCSSARSRAKSASARVHAACPTCP